MPSRFCHIAWITLLVAVCSGAQGLWAAPNGVDPALPTNVVAYTEQELTDARQRSTAEPTNSIAAWKLGRACFTWGKILTNRAAKELIYQEGVAACRRSLALDANSAPANYYLGMNIGRIADLKRNLKAFGMVKEVEKSFTRARALDEKFAHGGPDRNLGLLYQYAPGWPISVGDEKLGRKHLQRAVALAPNYPENRLNLAEAAIEWKDLKLLRSELTALDKLWPHAKTNLTGLAWELDWIDWQERLEALQRKVPPE